MLISLILIEITSRGVHLLTRRDKDVPDSYFCESIVPHSDIFVLADHPCTRAILMSTNLNVKLCEILDFGLGSKCFEVLREFKEVWYIISLWYFRCLAITLCKAYFYKTHTKKSEIVFHSFKE